MLSNIAVVSVTEIVLKTILRGLFAGMGITNTLVAFKVVTYLMRRVRR